LEIDGAINKQITFRLAYLIVVVHANDVLCNNSEVITAFIFDTLTALIY